MYIIGSNLAVDTTRCYVGSTELLQFTASSQLLRAEAAQRRHDLALLIAYLIT